ncbi:DMT family transporter [Sporolactobacillus pectinivorans]|uniref:DMT family transporter n=1 Tax=Sporolactobacillus pectinivorans TaxID=1591408 RepID=UPI000C26A6F8|nr:DMT family transporter [Sporolactobacillus pectinivorans]
MGHQKADLMLIAVTVFWGSSYLFMKTGLETLGIFNLTALRFLVAFVITAVLFGRRLRHTDKRTLFYALILGVVLLAVFASIMAGMKTTPASKAGFLVSLTVVFVPLLNSLLFRFKPELKMIVGVALSLIGIGLLTWNGRLAPESGDLYCVLGALANAVYIILADRFTKRVNSVALSIWQMGFTGILALLISMIIEVPRIPDTMGSWISVLGLGILCSAAGYMMQTVAQKYTTSTHAGLIFTLEPVFAALFAYIFTGETLSMRGYAGAGLVLISIIIMEINFRKISVSYFFPSKSILRFMKITHFLKKFRDRKIVR